MKFLLAFSLSILLSTVSANSQPQLQRELVPQSRSLVNNVGGEQIPFVTVGDPGQASVNYTFYVSRFEITNDQYCEFLNATAKEDIYGVYDESMTTHPSGGIIRIGTSPNYGYFSKSRFGNKPVVFVRWIDACRYVNWLHNGRPTGPQSPRTTEDGAYDLSLGLDSYGIIDRKPSARYGLPTEKEWRKANHYNASARRFWTHATQTDAYPVPTTATETGDPVLVGQDVVNYQGIANWNGSVGGNVLSVGSTRSVSYYGTSEGNGNVGEWTSDLRCISYICARLIYGGSYSTPPPADRCDNCVSPFEVAYGPIYGLPDLMQTPGELYRAADVGFRIVRLIPDPRNNQDLDTGSTQIDRQYMLSNGKLVAETVR